MRRRFASSMCIDELTPERVSLAGVAQQALAEYNTLENQICELEGDAETHEKELGVVVRDVRSLKEGVEAGETSASTAEF